eukprot:RCo022999
MGERLGVKEWCVIPALSSDPSFHQSTSEPTLQRAPSPQETITFSSAHNPAIRERGIPSHPSHPPFIPTELVGGPRTGLLFIGLRGRKKGTPSPNPHPNTSHTVCGCERREDALLQGQGLVEVIPGPLAELLHDVVGAAQPPPRRQQALHPNGASGVDSAGADPDLSAQAKTEPVREPRAGVVEDARAVHAVLEGRGDGGVLGHHGLGVPAAVGVDVRNRGVHPVHHLNGALQGPVFEVEVQPRIGLRPGHGGVARSQPNLNPLRGQLRQHGGQQGAPDQAGVHQQGFHRVAGRGVVALRVPHDPYGLLLAGGLVQVDVAHPVGVAQHGHPLGLGLNGLHHLVRASRNHQVDLALQLQHLRDPGTLLGLRLELHQRDRLHPSRQLGVDGLPQKLKQHLVAVVRLLAGLQQQPVGRRQGKRGDLREDVGAALEDDQKHAQGDSLLRQHQAVRQLHLLQHPPHHVVRAVRDLPQPNAQGVKLLLGELQAALQGRSDVVLLGPLQVLQVGAQDELPAALQEVGQLVDDLRALPRGELPQRPAALTGLVGQLHRGIICGCAALPSHLPDKLLPGSRRDPHGLRQPRSLLHCGGVVAIHRGHHPVLVPLHGLRHLGKAELLGLLGVQ